MKVKAKIKCQVNGIFYDAGEDINVDTMEGINKLNELGFIEPLTAKEIQNLAKPKTKLERGEL